MPINGLICRIALEGGPASGLSTTLSQPDWQQINQQETRLTTVPINQRCLFFTHPFTARWMEVEKCQQGTASIEDFLAFTLQGYQQMFRQERAFLLQKWQEAGEPQWTVNDLLIIIYERSPLYYMYILLPHLLSR